MSDNDDIMEIYLKLRKTIGQKWYFVTKIVLAYCEKKMF